MNHIAKEIIKDHGNDLARLLSVAKRLEHTAAELRQWVASHATNNPTFKAPKIKVPRLRRSRNRWN